MNMNKYLDIAPEVQQALADGRPVVALESTIISHGMPYPKNVETALLVEQTLRDNGAVPATIAILGGRLKAGLSKEEITYLGKAGRKVAKVSRRDLPVICARGADGATTVTTTMMIAHMHPGLCHRRHRRRAPRRRDDHGHLRRPRRAGADAGHGRVRGCEGHSRPRPDAGVSGDEGRARARLRHGRAARILHP